MRLGLFVLVLVIGSIGCGVVARDLFFNGNKEALKVDNRETPNRDVGYSKGKSKEIDFCSHGLGSFNATSDDKRFVPTGPNPLHNR
ncbi:hypothetical protein ACHQM5_030541 [Ranunculus cassubicifolius]